MLTLLLRSSKVLSVTKSAKIYQRESYADVMRIYIPETYDDIDLTSCTVTLQYVNPSSTAYAEILEAVTDDTTYLKDGYTLYQLPIDTSFTAVAGDVTMQLSITTVDESEDTTTVLRSSELTITVLPMSDYFAYVSDDSLTSLDNKIAELKTLADALIAAEEAMTESVPADLSLDDDSLLQLIDSDGNTIGDGVTIN